MKGLDIASLPFFLLEEFLVMESFNASLGVILSEAKARLVLENHADCEDVFWRGDATRGSSTAVALVWGMLREGTLAAVASKVLRHKRDLPLLLAL